MNQVATMTMETSKFHEQEGFSARSQKDQGSLDLFVSRPKRVRRGIQTDEAMVTLLAADINPRSGASAA